MFKYGFDEIALNAPEWYVEVNRQLERESCDEAARIAKESAKKCKDSGDRKDEVQALLAYTKALLASEDVWNARRFGEQSLELAQNLKDKSLEGAAMHMLAKVLVKDPQERRVAAMLDDRPVTFSEMCARQADKGLSDTQHKESWQTFPSAATSFAEKATKLFADDGNRLGEASVMITSASIALKGKRLAEAEQLAEQAVTKFAELGEARGEAAAQFVLYEIRMKDDLLEAAVAALDAIVQLSPDSPSSLGAAQLLAAEIQRLQGDLHDGVSRAAESAQYFHEAFDGNNKGQAVLSMAKSFLAAQQHDESTEAATAAVELFKNSLNKSGQAQALVMLAECCAKTGKQPEAVYRLEEAAFLYRQRKDKKNEAGTLSTLSKLQVAMIEAGVGTPVSEPLRHARRAVQLFEESWSGESPAAAEANLIVAKGLRSERDYEEAVGNATRSRDICEKLGDKTGEAAACALLANIFYEDKDKEQGLKMSERALAIAQETGDQEMLREASNLVTNQGKKKEAPTQEFTDMDIIFFKTRLARFDEFEGRRARYKDPGGAKSAIEDSAIEDKGPAGTAAKVKDERKVQYAIRWQRVANLNLAAMPIPPPVNNK